MSDLDEYEDDFETYDDDFEVWQQRQCLALLHLHFLY